MRVWMLGSGSRGNAVLVEAGGSRILIDAGFGPRILRRRMQAAGLAPESIEACLVTHEHSDHARGATRCARKFGWPMFATFGTISESHLAWLSTGVTGFSAGATLSFTGADITTFRTPHDAEEPVGVVVTDRSSGARVGIATDIGYLSPPVRALASDVDMLVIESNHDEDMLWNGSYTPWLKRRIAGNEGHLSNRFCAQLVKDSVTPRLRQVVLAHLSEENNTPRLAFDNMRAVLRPTSFRGSIMPAQQDTMLGPFLVAAGRSGPEQLTLF
ncbi:MAG TPA: MBL fold metallo-hydrolase [Gemmatimonadaceae bacterium]|nr:MBL fold metallo-hydrolase [Gemmatimonadaceae bacterium]